VFWNWCRNAVFRTTTTGATCEGPHGLVTEKYKEFLLLWLPSGRAIAYHKPMILPRRMPWGEVKDAFTYMGKDKYKNHKWDRIQAHAGLITENIVQAAARDILAEWMQRIDEGGFKIVGHVHDEVIVEHEDNIVEELNACIRPGVSWAPGLLLDAGGFTTRRYYKD
jgi:DNA polymerase